MAKSEIDANDVLEWFKNADENDVEDFLQCGLLELILELEQDDFFGTEGINKRFA
jgi:hypothetical protein